MILLNTMHPPEIYKLFGPVSVVITGLAIVIMIYRLNGDKGLLISHNAAANKKSYFMMLVVQSFTLPMLFLYWSKWLGPNLELPLLFTVFAGLTCIGLLVAAWIPATKGWRNTVHGLFAYGAAVLAPPMLIMLYASQQISWAAKGLVMFVLAYEIAVAAFAIIRKGLAKHFYLQFGYIFLFAFATLVVAYT